MLDGLFLGPAIAAVADALRTAALADRPVAVVGHPALARGLAERGVAVIALDAAARPLRKLRDAAARSRLDALPIGDRRLGALVGWGVSGRADWEDVLAEWSRAVADGGLVVLVDRAPSIELSRRALCGGLAELQQRPAGRMTVTSGIVTEL
ncbi:MAG: hypothetical protein H6709_19145 [Kofleriaceae bacterium]|nr:hypothetical protein [Kofleriaceae bacterium]MCB9574207.1 hypothetical protein [Kofleriaceae bacterium]